MSHPLTLLGWNLLLSVPIAILAACMCQIRPIRVRPALCHGIWLLVLLKLVTPPFIPVPVLPALASSTIASPDTEPSSASGPALVPVTTESEISPVSRPDAMTPENTDSAIRRVPQANRTTHAPSWHMTVIVFFTISALVTVAWWLAAIRQIQRLRRLLHGASPSTSFASQVLEDVAREFQFATTPKLYIVESDIVPMVWAEPGRPAVILSRKLVDALSVDQLRHVLAHELAHYARSDHWTNIFGFLITTLVWWHPIAWLARREMSLAAESCCDAMVLEKFSESRQSYARTLLTVVDFVNAERILSPALATTFGESSSLRRRFQMIANSEVFPRVSSGGWWLLMLGAVTLVLWPVRAQDNPRPSPAKPAGTADPTKTGSSDSTTGKSESGAKPDVAAGKYYVTGTVTDEETKKPIASAVLGFLVPAEQDPDKRMRYVSTDDQGRYRLEVPMGDIRLWFPELKPGYWLEPDNAKTPVATSAEKPVVTLDIAAKRGVAWPVQVTVENGLPENARPIISVMEVEDDTLRRKVANKEPVSFAVSPIQAITAGYHWARGVHAMREIGEALCECRSDRRQAPGSEIARLGIRC